MKAYGSKRTHGGCHTTKRRRTKKIHVRVIVKNHKRFRTKPIEIE